MKRLHNKKGVTLFELLAYLALVGIVVVLLTGTMSVAVRSYDAVNGQGALNTEAVNIMSLLMTEANAFNPEYATSCGVDVAGNPILNCVELVKDTIRQINYDTGIMEEVPSNIPPVQIKIDENNNIFIGNMQLNDKNYKVELFSYENVNTPNISFDCSDINKTNACQKFVLNIRLAIYRINSNGDIISNVAVYENRFSI